MNDLKFPNDKSFNALLFYFHLWHLKKSPFPPLKNSKDACPVELLFLETNGISKVTPKSYFQPEGRSRGSWAQRWLEKND